MYFSYKIHFETEQNTKCKLHAMYLITYFKYLHFNYLTTLQTNTYSNLGFSHALPAGLAESNGRLLLGIWRDSLHVTCGLTACSPGSAPGPTLMQDPLCPSPNLQILATPPIWIHFRSLLRRDGRRANRSCAFVP